MKSNSPIPARLLLNPVHLLSLGFGTGLAPKAPGTFGTMIGVGLFFLMPADPLLYLLICIAAFFIGIWLCQSTSKALGIHDHSGIVWDEIVGFLLTMIAVPGEWYWVLTGFVLFRLFDIWKPWPIRYFDRGVHGGLGIMLDDVLAAVYASIILQLLVYFV